MDEWRNEHTNTVGTYHCHGDYLSQGSHATVAFAESTSGPRHVPMLISQPITRLSGHHSIVNTALMHPTFPAILTAGIERNILLHSPTPATPFMPSSSLSLTPTEVRALPAEETPESARLVRRALGMSFAGESDEPDDDSMSIALFDQCVVHAVLILEFATCSLPGSSGKKVGWMCSRHGDGVANLRTKKRTRMYLWRTLMRPDMTENCWLCRSRCPNVTMTPSSKFPPSMPRSCTLNS